MRKPLPPPHDDRIYFRCSAAMRDQIRAIAHAQMTTPSTIIRQALACYINQTERHRTIESLIEKDLV
ncbi:hypothetical protein [Mesorhizobium sp. B2-8-9]|uniref:hypothetical protein n=1 Tax=Mesorhizobium sp. B2-8-9 TaxID=2589899 RepID=UPI00112DFF30|nr:hypothetical protein [Mesorhizobium sp. B2-8-9]TPI80430.1 hypothetical protein FJ423_12105 [Mesorhizobium sp. B2-8-9]